MSAEDAVAIERALIEGRPWPPPGVADTAATRELRDAIAADLAELGERGIVPEVPVDHGELAP